MKTTSLIPLLPRAGEEGGPKERSDLGGDEGVCRLLTNPHLPPLPRGNGSPLFSREEREKR
jgi:hypothetical protein